MRILALNYQFLVIKIEQFIIFQLKNNLKMFKILINVVKIRTLNTYEK